MNVLNIIRAKKQKKASLKAAAVAQLLKANKKAIF